MRRQVIDGIIESLHYLTMQPGNPIELGMGLFLAISILTVVLTKGHLFSKTSSASLFLSLFVVALCSLFLIFVAVFGKIWLIPQSGLQDMEELAISVLLLIAFLFIVVPATRILLRSSYFVSLTSWVLGLIGALCAVYVLHLFYEVPGEGTTAVETLQSVKEQVERKIEADFQKK